MWALWSRCVCVRVTVLDSDGPLPLVKYDHRHSKPCAPPVMSSMGRGWKIILFFFFLCMAMANRTFDDGGPLNASARWKKVEKAHSLLGCLNLYLKCSANKLKRQCTETKSVRVRRGWSDGDKLPAKRYKGMCSTNRTYILWSYQSLLPINM